MLLPVAFIHALNACLQHTYRAAVSCVCCCLLQSPMNSDFRSGCSIHKRQTPPLMRPSTGFSLEVESMADSKTVWKEA